MAEVRTVWCTVGVTHSRRRGVDGIACALRLEPPLETIRKGPAVSGRYRPGKGCVPGSVALAVTSRIARSGGSPTITVLVSSFSKFVVGTTAGYRPTPPG